MGRPRIGGLYGYSIGVDFCYTVIYLDLILKSEECIGDSLIAQRRRLSSFPSLSLLREVAHLHIPGRSRGKNVTTASRSPAPPLGESRRALLPPLSFL
jgi:hypothetical protein